MIMLKVAENNYFCKYNTYPTYHEKVDRYPNVGCNHFRCQCYILHHTKWF
jgi:hypothetical protein